ncbi:hypothetical protein D3C76_1725190 [compost metagenome]
MFKTRDLVKDYEFVFFAWGKTSINQVKQDILRTNYPNAISIHKLNVKGTIMDVNYPVHPLYMNSEYFIDASQGKLSKPVRR